MIAVGDTSPVNFLGIDIGTTKVAAVLVDGDGQLRACASRVHRADVAGPAGWSEQDPAMLLEAARAVVLELPGELRQRVRAVGLTGQMHGIVLLDAGGEPATSLITWQDGRCLEGDFLADLQWRTGYALRSGYGLATLAWLVQRGQKPAEAVRCATIHNYLATHLCRLQKDVIDPTDAAAWGLFDLARCGWDRLALAAVGIDVAMLPQVVASGALAGTIHPAVAAKWGLPADTPVCAGLGDNQSSLLATLTAGERQLALTIGTGAQVSAIMPARFVPPKLPAEIPYEYRPYPGGRYIAVAASLSGGNAWAWLARTVRSWQESLGQDPMDESAIYTRLNELGAKADDSLQFQPTFAGERYAPNLRASISNIDPMNFDLGRLARSLARGIARNLKAMFPADTLQGRQEIVGSGNALRHNPLLVTMVQEEFAMPVRLCEAREEAAIGAALHAAGMVK